MSENALQYRMSITQGSNHPLTALSASGQDTRGLFFPLPSESVGGSFPVLADTSVGKRPYAHQQKLNAHNNNFQRLLMAMPLLTW
jgi:hypothetical protein